MSRGGCAPARRGPLRTVFLLEELRYGGTQRHVVELVPRLDRAVFAPEVWTLAAGADLAGPVVSGGIPVKSLSAGRFVGPITLGRLARELRRSQPDVLVLLTALPNIWGRPIGRLVHVPLIVGNCRDSTPWHQHERWLWRLADHVICNSACVQRYLVDRYHVPGARLTVIPNGIDLARLDATADVAEASFKEHSTARVLLSVGRLVPPKDHVTLLEAFRLVAERTPDTELWLAGEGPERAKLMALATRPALAGRVRLLGGRADVAALLRRASVFVSSSREEGSPNAVLEAMAARVPIVATAVGGVPELLGADVDARLVAARDAEGLAAAMLTLLDDPILRRRLVASARARVERGFTVERMARETSNLLLRLACERGLLVVQDSRASASDAMR